VRAGGTPDAAVGGSVFGKVGASAVDVRGNGGTRDEDRAAAASGPYDFGNEDRAGSAASGLNDFGSGGTLEARSAINAASGAADLGKGGTRDDGVATEACPHCSSLTESISAADGD
jgi:RNA 3'-terminal phosphate cyclase